MSKPVSLLTPPQRARLARLRKKENDKGLNASEEKDLDGLMRRRRDEIAHARPRPTCCLAARIEGVVWLTVDYDNTPTEEARWAVAHNHDLRSEARRVNRVQTFGDTPAPKYCPFCGTGLPFMVRVESPPEPLCVITDGGYYCDTCRERADACLCYPPTCAFAPESTIARRNPGIPPKKVRQG